MKSCQSRRGRKPASAHTVSRGDIEYRTFFEVRSDDTLFSGCKLFCASCLSSSQSLYCIAFGQSSDHFCAVYLACSVP
ncbi:hypothetical protein M3J09_012740 [Ascochyta lentis]